MSDEENIDNLQNEEEDEEIEKKEEIIVEKKLDESIVTACISMICRTTDGFNFSYVNLNCNQKLLTDISILSQYINLRYIDVSHNYIDDISALSNITHLLTVDCSHNRIEEIPQLDLPYLRHFNLSNNKIKSLRKIKLPELTILNLNGNQLTSLKYESDNCCILTSSDVPQLCELEIRGNQLTSTEGLEELPNIRSVYFSKNKIEKVDGLGNLSELTSLHLRDNHLNQLGGFSDHLQTLQYLNLRENQVQSIDEIQKLKDLSLLRCLVLSGNPVSELDDYRMESLIAIRKLERLDKDKFLDEERSEAERIYEQRIMDKMEAENDDNTEIPEE